MIKPSNVPSLKEIAILKVTTLLWSEENIARMQPISSVIFEDLNLISPEYQQDDHVIQAWNVIKKTVNVVKGKVLNLLIPEPLKEEILQIVKPIGFQFLAWVHYHSNCYGIIKTLPTTFHWTSQGTVDRKAMAEMLVKDPTIDVDGRFKLACLYCMMPDIHALWEQLPDEHRNDLDIKMNPWRHDELVTFWTLYLRENASQLSELSHYCTSCNNVYLHGFITAVDTGNSIAAQFFSKQMTKAAVVKLMPRMMERVSRIQRDFIVRLRPPVIPKNYYGDVLYFMLLEVDEELQDKCLLYSTHYMKDLLEWPQHRFLKHLPRYPHNYGYCACLRDLCSKVIKGYEDEDVILCAWQQMPPKVLADIIEFIVRHRDNVGLREYYFRWEKCTRFTLPKMTTRQGRELLLEEGSHICSGLIYQKSWDLIRFFIKTCSATKKTLKNFKRKCRYYKHTHARKNWNKVLQICDELIQSFENKKIADIGKSAKKQRKI